MLCECCNKQAKGLRAVEFKGIPFTVRLCLECIRAGAIPYDLLVTLAWLGEVNPEHSHYVAMALYHGHSSAEFQSDCANFSDKMEQDIRELGQ